MKKQDELIGRICESYDYEKFITLNGNRNINPRNLHRIKDAITNSYLLSPICVNKNWEIIDGQHRYEAAKQLEFPVRYYMCKEYGLPEVQILNANQKNWTASDYLESYCELGYPEYLKVRNFLRKHKGIGLSNALTIINEGANKSPHIKRDFKNNIPTIKVNTFSNGTYKCGDLKLAEKIAEAIFELGNYMEFNKKRSFVIAFKKVYLNDNFHFSLFLRKVQKFPSLLKDCPNTEHFISMIESLYNYRNQNKVNLRY